MLLAMMVSWIRRAVCDDLKNGVMRVGFSSSWLDLRNCFAAISMSMFMRTGSGAVS